MKKQIKRVISALLAAVLLGLLLCACGKTAVKDVPVSELADAVCQALGRDDMADPGEIYVKGYMKKSAEEIGEYVILKNVMGTSIDEFGIFKAGTLTADELKTMAEEYLQLLQDSWMNYQPEEKPKLDDAEIKVTGDYVIYCILGDQDRASALEAFSAALK